MGCFGHKGVFCGEKGIWWAKSDVLLAKRSV